MSEKEKKIAAFKPDNIGAANLNIYGLPFTQDEADIVLLPVPWDVTTSYSKGTANGPQAIFDASLQVDLYNPLEPELWKKGIFMQAPAPEWMKKNKKLGKHATKIIDALEQGIDIADDAQLAKDLNEINHFSGVLNDWVYQQTRALLNQGKKVGVVGGEHSVPLGFMKACADKFGDYSILQIDAHADLRKAYEGFTYSHASIFHNALKEVPAITKLVQVGVRDCSFKELKKIKKKEKISTHFDWDIKQKQYEGASWQSICEDIINQLSDTVYISFDIDGLDPKLCPNTGTPVPGGIQFEEIQYLFKLLKQSDKKVIGFDLCEVAPGSNNNWDANVGARVLFMLCGMV